MKKKLIIILLSAFLSFLFAFSIFEEEIYSNVNEFAGQAGIIVTEVVANNKNLRHDENLNFSDYIIIYNNTSEIINLENYTLSDDFSSLDKWTFPFCEIKPYKELCVFLDGEDVKKRFLHTNFSLNNEGEELILRDDEKNILFKWSYDNMDIDISYAYKNGKYEIIDKNKYGYNTETKNLSFKQYLALKTDNHLFFSKDSGFYENDFDLEITSNNKNFVIRYTLDGSIPNINSNLYLYPIKITSRIDDENEFISSSSAYEGTSYSSNYVPNPKDTKRATILKACAFVDGVRVSDVYTNTYFVDEKGEDLYSLPVFSLVCDPDDLFSDETGIYVVGNSYSNKNNVYEQKSLSTPANYNQRGEEWQRACSLEYFENSEKVYEQDLKIQIFGGASRGESKKSFKLIADRSEEEKINYSFFKDLKSENKNPIESFDEIILRSGGSLAEGLFFLDSIHSCAASKNLDTQASRSVVVFLNGNYYGIYQLVEALSEDYISNHYDVECDDIEIFKTLEYDMNNIKNDFYKELLDYAKNNDLSVIRNYDYISSKIDIENMIEYFVFQIYIENTDWPAANNMVWRVFDSDDYDDSTYIDGRYRYVLYDTDCGMNGLGDYRLDDLHPTMFHWVFENKYTSYDDLGIHSLDIIEELIKNEEFKHTFINKFCDRVNFDYRPDVFYDILDEIVAQIEPEIVNDMNRYNHFYKDIEFWEYALVSYKEYVNNRFEEIFVEMADFFDCDIGHLNIEKCKGGCIDISNNIQVGIEGDFNGKYMSGFDIVLTAVPDEGYKFAGWSDGSNDIVRHIMFNKNMLDISIQARFEKVE